MDERTPPMTPQLALRVAIIGGLALAMFAVILVALTHVVEFTVTPLAEYDATAVVANFVPPIVTLTFVAPCAAELGVADVTVGFTIAVPIVTEAPRSRNSDFATIAVTVVAIEPPVKYTSALGA